MLYLWFILALKVVNIAKYYYIYKLQNTTIVRSFCIAHSLHTPMNYHELLVYLSVPLVHKSTKK